VLVHELPLQLHLQHKESGRAEGSFMRSVIEGQGRREGLQSHFGSEVLRLPCGISRLDSFRVLPSLPYSPGCTSRASHLRGLHIYKAFASTRVPHIIGLHIYWGFASSIGLDHPRLSFRFTARSPLYVFIFFQISFAKCMGISKA
jgi:hypothetical protein